MKDFFRFFTTDDIADYMVSILYPIPSLYNDYKHVDIVLVPSAGDGALIKALNRYSEQLTTIAIEVNPEYKEGLKKIASSTFITDIFNPDFDLGIRVDATIANLLFDGDNDIDKHLHKICELTKYRGTIVSIVPEDYNLQYIHEVYPITNWVTNKDGRIIPIKIIKFSNTIL